MMAPSRILLNLGPGQTGCPGVLRLAILLEDEHVRELDVHTGSLHRAFEKHAENLPFAQVTPYASRLDYVGDTSAELAYALAVEALLGVAAPPRASWLRVIVVELARIGTHLTCLGGAFTALGMAVAAEAALAARDRVVAHLERLTGRRVAPAYVRIGGVAADASPAWIQELATLCRNLDAAAVQLESLGIANPLFQRQTRGIGALSRAQALDHAITGIGLRATGLSRDLRRLEPYACYGGFDVDVPVASGAGDSLDRHTLRLAEIRASVALVLAAGRAVPEGPVRLAEPTDELAPPAGECYVRVESPRGELGVHVIADGSRVAARVKVRSPSAATLACLPQLARGHTLAELPILVGSLDINTGEVDK